MDDGDGHNRTTDWKAVFAAVGIFYASLTGLGWLWGEYLLGRMDQRVVAHATNASDSRRTLVAEIERRAEAATDRIRQLERNCDVVQDWIKRTESRLDELDRWRANCGQKMAKAESQIERDLADMAAMNARIERLEGLVSKGRRE
ncbi:MAG: hypothetical protein RLZZ524_409 [Pseudomonadota bacterium]|jgi:septal ring factor EnvC (AmiA/AmiB activator)